MSTLAWGWRYALVRPLHFRIDYQINPFMDRRRQPDAALALEQWAGLIAEIEAAGGSVGIIEQRPDSPDMVYAMNLGLAVTKPTSRLAVISHMRYAQRRNESQTARAWFGSHGYSSTDIGRSGVGAHFEAGDAFPHAGRLLVGFGPRTEELALKDLAIELDVRVHGLRIAHPGMYHLDLAFCPLDESRALVCPAAFDEASAASLLDLIPQPIVLTEDEAMTFCANSIVVGQRILMPVCPRRVRRELETAGFDIVMVDVSEFHKAGGSIRCMTNPLDVTIGRDLDLIPGGEIVIPRP